MATNAATSPFPFPPPPLSLPPFPFLPFSIATKSGGKERERGGLYGQLFQNQKSHTERNTQIISE